MDKFVFCDKLFRRMRMFSLNRLRPFQLGFCDMHHGFFRAIGLGTGRHHTFENMVQIIMEQYAALDKESGREYLVH